MDLVMMSKEMKREVYFRTIKAILMGVGEDDKDSTAMANGLLDDKDISHKNAFDIAKGYAEARQYSLARLDKGPDHDFQVDSDEDLL